ncbi:hypothetical protein [Corallococcus sp. Z5C101001]|uniref:hypothetical protein n=1 Tax=Corallococcus sp. Z5C101001 TaxID=2596829 RepID=UPI00117D825F|nr:hypothetical protein [Corallococcus sp. Z5C101001]TSC31933.1 hypothetical protein FOF48_15065 [Corallococcus sp. Z5C101001]
MNNDEYVVNCGKYVSVLRGLGLPEKAVAYLTGELRLPNEVADVPFHYYGFPPALIPLWSSQSGPSYYGYWWHWGMERRTTMVHVGVEGGCRVTEYARDLTQLLTTIALNEVVSDEKVTDGLREFARVAEVDDLEGLERIAWESGDLLYGLLKRPEFRHDPPVSCFEDERLYPGDFPTKFNVVGKRDLTHFAGLEGEREVAAVIAAQPDAPEWFRSNRQREVFDGCLRAGNYSGAWMSLNSSGWSLADAGRALAELARRTGDPILFSITDAWIANNPPKIGGY